MNTLNTLKNGMAPILKQEKSVVLFDDSVIDFGFPAWQLQEILNLWNRGKSVAYISKTVKRNQHEVFMALYQFWMQGEINDIEKAFAQESSLLVPGKEQKYAKRR